MDDMYTVYMEPFLVVQQGPCYLATCVLIVQVQANYMDRCLQLFKESVVSVKLL